MQIVVRHRRLLERRLGIRIVEEWAPGVTHLIAHTFRRTTKLMCAICAGIHILVPEYLEVSHRAGHLVEEAPYLLRDEICEAAFAKKHKLKSFSVAAAVERAR